MGFGFNFFFIFILLPLTAILLLAWLITRQRSFGKALGLVWLGVIGLVVLSHIVQALTAKKKLEKEDYYGQYIIDRDFFPGEQADWQYNSFRFEIKENDSIYFHVTDKERIIKTFRGAITTVIPYSSARLVLDMQQPSHHILSYNPTTYRSTWSFYLVFYSPKFNNMYFRKGEWKPLNEK